MKKVTKKWTMKDGTKIRICDMEDSHLLNCIHLLERCYQKEILAGYTCLSSVNGEMAYDSIDIELSVMEDNDPSYIYPIYEDLQDEAIRRKL